LAAISEEALGSKPGTERQAMSATAMRDECVLETTMNAMIIYEEYGSAGRANALLKRASDRADAATQWSVKPWRLDMLDWPPLPQDAQRDGAEAHLMVLAVGYWTELPPGLLSWLAGWARQRRVEDAALAVFDGGSGDTFSPTATPALCEFAQRYGLSMIFGEVSPTEDEQTDLWADLHEREVAQTATMAHIVEQVSPGYYQHAGINEQRWARVKLERCE
jgi:hypothetical protein